MPGSGFFCWQLRMSCGLEFIALSTYHLILVHSENKKDAHCCASFCFL